MIILLFIHAIYYHYAEHRSKQKGTDALHGVYWGMNPSQKPHIPSFLSSSPLNLQTVQAPFFRQSQKIKFFSEPQKC